MVNIYAGLIFHGLTGHPNKTRCSLTELFSFLPCFCSSNNNTCVTQHIHTHPHKFRQMINWKTHNHESNLHTKEQDCVNSWLSTLVTHYNHLGNFKKLWMPWLRPELFWFNWSPDIGRFWKLPRWFKKYIQFEKLYVNHPKQPFIWFLCKERVSPW